MQEINGSGLYIDEAKKVILKPEEVGIIWSPCVGQPFYPKMVRFSTSNPSMILLVEGEDAINVLNELVGHFDPEKAEWFTIRHKFGKNKMENVIHSTSDENTFIREASLFFRELI